MTTTTSPDTTDTIEVPAGHGLMSTLDRSGDIRVMWDRTNADEVQSARRQFDQALKDGFLAYRAEGKQGERGTQIRQFDPEAERIILVKQNVGG